MIRRYGNLLVSGISVPSEYPATNTFRRALFDSLQDLSQAAKPISLVMDPSKTDLKRSNNEGNEFRVAILMEPPAVLPTNGNPANFRHFDVVIELGRVQSRTDAPHIVLPWPQYLSPANSPVEGDKYTKAIMVCGNKHSFIPGELYTLRRKLIRQLQDVVDLYGTNWNLGAATRLFLIIREALYALGAKAFSLNSASGFQLSIPQNYCGSPLDKIAVTSNYAFSLVIENWGNYCTEKLFDAFRAGSTPIYIGAPLVEVGIPEKFAIEVNSADSARKIAESVRSVLKDSAYRNQLEAKRELATWLESNSNPHLFSNVAERVTDEVAKRYLNSSFDFL